MKDKMAYELPEGTVLALRNLIQQATKDGVVVAGFAFRSEPPAITNFGNCSDKSDVKLYEFLCKLAHDKAQQGLVKIDKVEEPV